MLAQFCGYSETAKTISSEHGVAVDRFQVRTYDPTKASYAAGDRWRVLHDRARKAYVDDVSTIRLLRRNSGSTSFRRYTAKPWRHETSYSQAPCWGRLRRKLGVPLLTSAPWR